MMSATPIPRTMAMSYYADLDVSVIDELPPGRTPVATRLVSEPRRAEVIRRVRDACMAGSQAYWVCPLIEDSGSEGSAGKPSAGGHARRPERRAADDRARDARRARRDVSGAEGRPDTRAAEERGEGAVMEAFSSGAIQLLVATTVIEVGVDVPNATLMVIEHAERMGLSQLHQLRGRVGRGAEAATCVLLYAQPAERHGARTAQDHLREPRRVRDRAPRPPAARAGRAARRAPERNPAPPIRGPRRRSRSSRSGARRRRERCCARTAARRDATSRGGWGEGTIC